jgi:polyisoprenoid-binding protein YceI
VKISPDRNLLFVLPALLIGLIALGATSAPASLPAVPADAPADAKTLGVDGTHSFVMFKVRHNGVNDAWGRFNQVSGKIVLDEETASASSVSFEIATESVDSGNEKRDGHLRSPDFFNAVEFPIISFKSETVKSTSEHSYDVSGHLTLHGETRPLSVTVTSAVAKGSRGSIYGFASTFTIKRSDFGMDYGVEQGILGDEVTVILNLEAGEH